MRYTYHPNSYSYHTNWTVGGLIAYLLIFPVFVTLLAAPELVLAVGLGVAAPTLVTKVVALSEARSDEHGSASQPPPIPTPCRCQGGRR